MVGVTLYHPSPLERMVIINEIRVNNSIVINVNDNGDTITVNVEDQLFIEKFYVLCDRLDGLKKELDTSEVKSKSEREKLQFMIEKTRGIMADIDSLFGEDACKKVFGDIVPNVYLIAEFFDQLTPMVEQYVGERKKRINAKYSNKRKGARSNKYRTKEKIIQDAMR